MNKIKIFRFLNDLRESGVTNMFGAAPYIEAEFGISDSKSKELLSEWMDNFDPTGEYEQFKP